MGHYDSDYEYDDEMRRKERMAKYASINKRVRDLRRDLREDVIVPDRFIESLEDLENWIKQNLKD